MINMQTIQNTQDIINAFNNNYKKVKYAIQFREDYKLDTN